MLQSNTAPSKNTKKSYSDFQEGGLTERQLKTEEEMIRRILAETRTIAVVGLSSQPERAGYYVPAYLQAQGYRILPVNPYLSGTVLGEKPYPDLEAVPVPVDLVLLFRRSEAVPPFVEQAIRIGAKAVWMQLGIVNEPAAERARQAGLEVVMDRCMLVEHRAGL
jgi:predicted CoA-binding protein